ncbi:MAG TPA: efflux RND transporter periplasmic adaptor subunit [Vicinamibacterales bacterium]
MERRRIIVGAVVGASMSGLAVWALQPVVAVDLDTANTTSGTIVRRIVATGTLEAVRTVDIGSQVSGNIQSLSADFNSIVHTGQIVARLDPSLYEAQLRETQAALGKARADEISAETVLRDADIKLSRAEALAARQLIPVSDLDAARIAAATARADLAAAKSNVVDAAAQVKQAQFDVDRTVITSPIDGIVVARDVDVGQTLAASVQSPTLFSIAADLRRMQVQVAIDESDVDGIAPGEPVTFQVGAYPNEPFHGVVQEVRLQPVTSSGTGTTSPSTSAATLSSLLTVPAAPAAAAASNSGPSGTTVSYTTIVDVANPDERLRPGMTATVVLDGSRRENAVRIPNLALMFRPSEDVMAVLRAPETTAASEFDGGDPAARTRLVWVRTGATVAPKSVRVGLSDGAWTELVSGGLTPNLPLVTSATVERRRRIARY